MKFRESLAKKILAGAKTSTWRLFDDKDLHVGDRVEFVVSETGEKFAEVEIVSMKEKLLADIEEGDYDGHERYESPEKMVETFREYYGDKVTLDTKVKILVFQIIQSCA